MIIWLNGAFGVGKTTVARELVSLLPNSRVADPERIGYVMRRTFWRDVDYQDVRLWRRLVRRQVAWAGRNGVSVVPMTVVRRQVFDELTSQARVFVLVASRPTLEDRIARSEGSQAWRRGNLDRCLQAFDTSAWGETIDTDERTPNEIAHVILALL